jgi:hypothetical protein
LEPDQYQWPAEEIKGVDRLECLWTYADEFGRSVLEREQTSGFRRRIRDTVPIRFAPTEVGDEVPAFTHFGDLEEGRCPPQVHVAALRWLHDHYGADLVGLDDRVLEVIPGRRPASRTEAFRLAEDLHTYADGVCTGNINSTIPEIAACLMKSPVWSFYWESWTLPWEPRGWAMTKSLVAELDHVAETAWRGRRTSSARWSSAPTWPPCCAGSPGG